MSGTYLYVGSFGDPRCSASGQRVLHIARVLRSVGYETLFCSDGYAESFVFDGFSFVSARKEALSLGPMATVIGYWNLITAQEVMECVNKIMSSNKDIKAVICYNCSHALQSQIMRLAHSSSISVFGDVTEWYEINRDSGFGNYLLARSVDRRIRKLDCYLDGVIAISDYLEKYYAESGVRCIKVPPIFDFDSAADLDFPTNEAGKLKIVYTGFPANGKDDLTVLIDAVCATHDRFGSVLQLDIVGPTQSYLQNLSQRYSTSWLFEHGIHVHGKVSHEEAKWYQDNANLCFLIRENKRYAKAGFSTKFAECMSSGVLMCCNDVGGADQLIDDGVNGFLLPAGTIKEVLIVLERCLALSERDLYQMRVKARETAAREFSEDNYRNALVAFLGA